MESELNIQASETMERRVGMKDKQMKWDNRPREVPQKKRAAAEELERAEDWEELSGAIQRKAVRLGGVRTSNVRILAMDGTVVRLAKRMGIKVSEAVWHWIDVQQREGCTIVQEGMERKARGPESRQIPGWREDVRLRIGWKRNVAAEEQGKEIDGLLKVLQTLWMGHRAGTSYGTHGMGMLDNEQRNFEGWMEDANEKIQGAGRVWEISDDGWHFDATGCSGGSDRGGMAGQELVGTVGTVSQRVQEGVGGQARTNERGALPSRGRSGAGGAQGSCGKGKKSWEDEQSTAGEIHGGRRRESYDAGVGTEEESDDRNGVGGDRLDVGQPITEASSKEGGPMGSVCPARHTEHGVLGSRGNGLGDKCGNRSGENKGGRSMESSDGLRAETERQSSHDQNAAAGYVTMLQNLFQGQQRQYTEGQPLQRLQAQRQTAERQTQRQRETGDESGCYGATGHKAQQVAGGGAGSSLLHGESGRGSAQKAVHEMLGEGREQEGSRALLRVRALDHEADTHMDKYAVEAGGAYGRREVQGGSMQSGETKRDDGEMGAQGHACRSGAEGSERQRAQSEENDDARDAARRDAAHGKGKVAAVIAKRGRGRPLGSKNKKKAGTTAVDADGARMMEGQNGGVHAVEAGGCEHEGVQEKRGRGRPKGSKNKKGLKGKEEKKSKQGGKHSVKKNGGRVAVGQDIRRFWEERGMGGPVGAREAAGDMRDTETERRWEQHLGPIKTVHGERNACETKRRNASACDAILDDGRRDRSRNAGDTAQIELNEIQTERQNTTLRDTGTANDGRTVGGARYEQSGAGSDRHGSEGAVAEGTVWTHADDAVADSAAAWRSATQGEWGNARDWRGSERGGANEQGSSGRDALQCADAARRGAQQNCSIGEQKGREADGEGETQRKAEGLEQGSASACTGASATEGDVQEDGNRAAGGGRRHGSDGGSTGVEMTTCTVAGWPRLRQPVEPSRKRCDVWLSEQSGGTGGESGRTEAGKVGTQEKCGSRSPSCIVGDAVSFARASDGGRPELKGQGQLLVGSGIGGKEERESERKTKRSSERSRERKGAEQGVSERGGGGVAREGQKLLRTCGGRMEWFDEAGFAAQLRKVFGREQEGQARRHDSSAGRQGALAEDEPRSVHEEEERVLERRSTLGKARKEQGGDGSRKGSKRKKEKGRKKITGGQGEGEALHGMGHESEATRSSSEEGTDVVTVQEAGRSRTVKHDRKRSGMRGRKLKEVAGGQDGPARRVEKRARKAIEDMNETSGERLYH